MQYDFDLMTQRRHTNSLKWEVGETELPMWVADMDFMTAPQIQAAVEHRARQGIYGYTMVPQAWYQAIQGWWQRRHQFTMDTDWMMFCTGVIPAISSMVRKLTTAGENILVQPPVYNIFYHCIQNNGRNVLENRLRYDGQSYRIDFDDLEKKLKNPQTTMMILCNPHNPVGKLWDRETLAAIGALCERHHVLVLADEIHCDVTDPGCDYIPFASVSDKCSRNSITCIAPTKTFNLAGLQTAAVVVPDENLRHKVNRALNTDEVAEPNVFAVEAAIAAYTQGDEWLEELRRYIFRNKQRVAAYVARELPELSVMPSEATYLIWLDCRRLAGDSSLLCEYLQTHSGLRLSDGTIFRGSGFLRMNLACPAERLEDGLRRLRDGVKAYMEWIPRQC